MSQDWIHVMDMLPSQNEVVETKVEHFNLSGAYGGAFNEQDLILVGKLWYLADGSMYVYYTPTHWRPKT